MAVGDIWLAGGNPNDIYKSTDGGTIWDSSGINAPLGQTAVRGISVAPNGDIWLLGGSPIDIYRSTDGGTTWDSTGINAPSGQSSVQGIAFAPNGDIWIAGISPDDIYKSTDGGTIWDSSGINAPPGQISPTGIAVAPNGDIWIAGNVPDDIYKSTDGGATWDSTGINAPPGQTSVQGIAVAPNGDIWLAGRSPDDIYKSTDGGTTWDSTGINAPSGQSSVQGIAFDPRSTPTFTDAEEINFSFGVSEATGATALPFDADAEEINFSFGVSEATGSTQAPLTLADSDDAGLDVDAKALLVASDAGTTGNFIYEDADRGGTDTPLDGELGLGADETLISGIRRRTATLLQLNDNNNPAALDIGAYFSTGGAGNDLTIYLQTLDDGEVSFPASNSSFSRVDQVRFTIPSDVQTLLENLVSGDRFIIKFARAATVDFTGDAETINFSTGLAEATGSTLAPITGDASPVGFSFSVAQATGVGGVQGPSAELDLGNVPGTSPWLGAVLIPPDFVEGGGAAYLREITTVGTSIRISISVAATGSYSTFGPELVQAWLNYENAIVFTDDDGDSLTLKGPNHPDNSFRDPSEPYFWTPDNNTEWRNYWNAAHDNLIVTLNREAPTSAGDASLIELSITLAEAEGEALDPVYGSANAIDFALSLSEADGSIGISGHAEPLGFSFALSEPTVMVAVNGDASAIAFSFVLSEADGSEHVPAEADERERLAFMGLGGDTPLYALVIMHPDITDDVYLVTDTVDHQIDGNTHIAVAFQAHEPQSKEGEIRQARLQIDNVGQELMQWIEDSRGGQNATMRIMRIVRPEILTLENYTAEGNDRVRLANDSEITWEQTMGVSVADVNMERVSVRLTGVPFFGRPAVLVRHDPQTSPGIF